MTSLALRGYPAVSRLEQVPKMREYHQPLSVVGEIDPATILASLYSL